MLVESTARSHVRPFRERVGERRHIDTVVWRFTGAGDLVSRAVDCFDAVASRIAMDGQCLASSLLQNGSLQ
jgi:hypothetical protein